MPGPIVFVGDSITDADRLTTEDGLGFGWVRMVAEVLRGRGETREIVNRGVSGDRVVDLVARWERDVLALEPSLLTVYVGINDVWRRYDSGQPTAAADFETGYRALLSEVVGSTGPRLVLVEPFVAPTTEEQERWEAEDLGDKRAAVARLATEFGASLVSLQRLVDVEIGRVGAERIAADGVHPTPHGARLIAQAWLDVVGHDPG